EELVVREDAPRLVLDREAEVERGELPRAHPALARREERADAWTELELEDGEPGAQRRNSGTSRSSSLRRWISSSSTGGTSRGAEGEGAEPARKAGTGSVGWAGAGATAGAAGATTSGA